jgi:lysyl-tRNA synthetase class 1
LDNLIGRGTWLDKLALEIIQREKSLGRSLDLVRVESGLGASGIPHVGSLGDALRGYGAKLALEDQGVKSELVAFTDDMDGLRKVPAGLSKDLEKYLAMPVSRVPDPFGCHSSYGGHMGSLLRDALDRVGAVYRFESGAEAYKRNLLGRQAEEILSRSAEIGERIRELTGQEKYEDALPYFAICSSCGRMYTTKALSYDRGTASVHYRCEGTQLRERKIEGCGHEGDSKVADGEGKLSWKVEFAARWAALDIRFEAYGKDIADSVRVNDWVAENILSFHPPYHVQYEMFLDKSGKKISKSAGNVFTPQRWFRYGSTRSLVLLMYKRIAGTRNLSAADIPKYMDEYDYLEDLYFGKAKLDSEDKLARMKGLYEYTNFLRPPKAPSAHLPYRLLAEIAYSAPAEDVVGYSVRRLQSYRMVGNATPELEERIMLARNWSTEVMGEPPKVELTEKEREVLAELATSLTTIREADKVQFEIFEIAKRRGIPPGDYFKLLYRVLLGSEKGPRLGPYIVDTGVERTISSLERAIKED